MINPKIPEWYAVSSTAASPVNTNKRPRKNNFVRRTQHDFSKLVSQESSHTIEKKRWIDLIDDRAVVAGILLLLCCFAMLYTVTSLIGGAAAAFMLLASLKPDYKKALAVCLGISVVSAVVIFPAVFNLVTPGQPILWIVKRHDAGIEPLYVTLPGLIIAGRFLLRSIICTFAAYALVFSMDATRLLYALRRLGLPRVFGMILTMTYRYLIVMIKAAEEIHFAKLSRTIKPETRKQEYAWTAAGIGSLFRRSYYMAGEVHFSMVSRGYNGDLKTRYKSHWSWKDNAWLMIVLLIIMLLLYLNH